LTVKGPGGASIEPATTPLADRVDGALHDPDLPDLTVEPARADSIVLSARASALVAKSSQRSAFFISDFDALDGRVALQGGRALVLDAGVYGIKRDTAG